MIALTKEFKQLLKEMFDTRGTTEIHIDDLVEILAVDAKELRLLLEDNSLKNEYKIVQAKDGELFVQRSLESKLEGKKLTSAYKIQWDNIGGCPCFTCYELDRCDIGNPISSIDCPLFTKWLFAEPKETEEKGKEGAGSQAEGRVAAPLRRDTTGQNGSSKKGTYR